MNQSEVAGEDLYRLLYYSRARADAAETMAQEFLEILSIAQRKNARLDITGALLACSGWLMQILEGPRGHVSSAFDCIRKDARHGSLQVMKAGQAAERFFPDWSMCGRTISTTDDEIVGVLETDNIFDPRSFSADKAVALLQRVAFLKEKYPGEEYLHID